MRPPLTLRPRQPPLFGQHRCPPPGYDIRTAHDALLRRRALREGNEEAERPRQINRDREATRGKEPRAQVLTRAVFARDLCQVESPQCHSCTGVDDRKTGTSMPCGPILRATIVKPCMAVEIVRLHAYIHQLLLAPLTCCWITHEHMHLIVE